MPRKKATAPPEPPETIELSGQTFEIRVGTWGQLGVGSWILDAGRRPWAVIEAAQPQQFEYGKTCWLKFRARNGDEVTIAPRYVNHRVRILIDPTALPPKPAWAQGAEEAWLLAEKLGATEIATQDHATGEVWCPDYTAPNPAKTGFEPLLHHLRICHAVNVDAVGTSMEALAAHDAAHSRPVGGAGFTHRHVPEDHTLL